MTKLKKIFFGILFLWGINSLLGCLASTPTKSSYSGASYNKKTPITPTKKEIAPKIDIKKEEPQNSNAICHDINTGGHYEEDVSANCVQTQMQMAYQVVGSGLDPMGPYCMLVRETGNKKESDPDNATFNRTAVCRIKGRYCGAGLSQFTFGTWNRKEETMTDLQRDKLKKCLNTLSQNSSLPINYTNPHLVSMSGSVVEDEQTSAQSKGPSNELTPFYRDHALCMKAIYIAEIEEEVGSSLKAVASKYNGHGTAGYANGVVNCAKKMSAKNRASGGDFYLADKLQNQNTISSRTPSSSSYYAEKPNNYFQESTGSL